MRKPWVIWVQAKCCVGLNGSIWVIVGIMINLLCSPIAFHHHREETFVDQAAHIIKKPSDDFHFGIGVWPSESHGGELWCKEMPFISNSIIHLILRKFSDVARKMRMTMSGYVDHVAPARIMRHLFHIQRSFDIAKCRRTQIRDPKESSCQSSRYPISIFSFNYYHSKYRLSFGRYRAVDP